MNRSLGIDGPARDDDGRAGGPIDGDESLRQRVVDRPGEMQLDRIDRPGQRRSHSPLARRERRSDCRRSNERFLMAANQRRPVCIAPSRIDSQPVSPSRRERCSELLIWPEAALDPARIEENGEALMRPIPQLGIGGEKCVGDGASALIEQCHMSRSVSLAHRTRKVDVELEQILRKRVSRRINGSYHRPRYDRASGNEDALGECCARVRRGPPPTD
jgi:hypothetical protein